MSISAIIPSPATLLAFGGTGLADAIAQALKNLQTTLQAGDISGAQKALTSFVNLEQASASQSGMSAPGVQLNADTQTLSDALSAGNLSAANSAFAAVQSDVNGSAAATPTSSALSIMMW